MHHYPIDMQMYQRSTNDGRSNVFVDSRQQFYQTKPFNNGGFQNSTPSTNALRYPAKPSRSQIHQFQQIDQLSDHSTSCGSDSSEEYFGESSNSYSPPAHYVKKTTIIDSTNPKNNQIQNAPLIPEEAKYKTEMCKNWVEIGKCNYGEKCKFAHGKSELVQKVAANKHFKTKPCKQFFEQGTCNYGARCHFLHDLKQTQQISTTTQPQQTEYYQKKLNFPELYMNDTIETPLQPRRLEFFSKLTAKQLFQDNAFNN